MSPDVEHAMLMRIVQAWERPGPYPRVHEKQKEILRSAWPTLADAVERAALVYRAESAMHRDSP